MEQAGYGKHITSTVKNLPYGPGFWLINLPYLTIRQGKQPMSN